MDKMPPSLWLLIIGLCISVSSQQNQNNMQPDTSTQGSISGNTTCDRGYEKYEGRCEDINECVKGTYKCVSYSNCKNSQGSYYCECLKGYRKEDNTTKVFPNSTKDFPNSSKKCIDIDECTESPSLCGPNSNCTNTPGDYSCSCLDGFRRVFPGTPKEQCNVRCKKKVSTASITQQSCNTILCQLDDLISSATPSCEGKGTDATFMLQFLNHLDSLLTGFGERGHLEFVNKLLLSVEDVAQDLGLLNQNITLRSNTRNIELHALQNTAMDEELSLQSTRSRLSLDWKAAAEENTTGLAMIGFVEFHNLSTLLKGASFLDAVDNSSSHELISHVLTAFASRRNTKTLISPISFQLRHKQAKNHKEAHCVYWSNDDKSWKSTGCVKLWSSENETVCRCTHMTSFAILMALQDIESWELAVITKICLSISLICLILCIVTFTLCRSLQGTRNTIHTHLCVSLFFGNLIFLLGVTAVGNKVTCGVVAGLLHYFYLAAFCWMALEGLELYLMLVRVFDTHILKKRHLFTAGYGVPAAIVIISAAVYSHGYGTTKHCWLSLERNFIWSFIGPICVILLVNCGIFLLTVWKLAEKMSSINPDQGKYKKIRAMTLTAVAQLCILGCTWIFGFLQFGSAALVFAYIFSILNSMQGLQIFVLHCLMQRKVRTEYFHWLCAISHCQKPSAYSEFNSTSATNTLTKVKQPSNESNL